MLLRQLIATVFALSGFFGLVSSTAYADMELDGGMDMSADLDADSSDGGFDMSADVSDDADMGELDAADMPSGDLDSGTDVGLDIDSSTDMPASDDAAGDLAVSDAGDDAGAATYTFSGTATLRGAITGQVSIQLTDVNDESTQRNVASGERFAFEGLPAGVYDVRVSAAGFDTVEDRVDLSSDVTRNYVLFTSATSMVYIEVELDEQPTGTVTLSATSERGSFVESIEIESGIGQFDDEFKAGTWQLEFRSEGFRKVRYTLDVTPDSPSTTVSVRLYRDSVADVFINEGCSCDVSSASRAQTTLVLVVLILFVGVSRARRRLG